MPSTPRAATVADYPVFARLFPELHVEDPLLTRDEFASRMLPNVLVLEHANATAIGYAAFRFHGTTTHVVHLVIAPEARSQGAGRALMDEVRVRAIAAGCTRWCLNVMQTNAPAIRLYERSGLAIEQEAWSVTTRWSELAKLEGKAASAFVPDAADDEAIASVLSVEAGRLTFLRSRSVVVQRALRAEDGALVGFAAFDPTFPGVFPIQVAHPRYARSLLDALAPAAQEDRVVVTVEGDRALYEALSALGARLNHTVFRMGGELRA